MYRCCCCPSLGFDLDIYELERVLDGRDAISYDINSNLSLNNTLKDA
jgi:hypothetical protein